MSNSSDDEDVPLGDLLKKAVVPNKSSAPSPKKRNSESELQTKKKKIAKVIEPIRKGGSSVYDTPKGQLIQKLLCRWWYAIEWPTAEDLIKSVPSGYEQLEGYVGVFICVKGDDIGKIIDCRNGKTCPNFKNLNGKTATELKELLKKALENQKKMLIENEGADSPYESGINTELTWLSKFNAAKADK